MNKELILRKLKENKPDFERLGVTEIGLFGSYSRNEQTLHSDIDILIDFDSKKENFDNYMTVSEIIEKLFAEQKVEIITKKGLSPYIGKEIMSSVVYA